MRLVIIELSYLEGFWFLLEGFLKIIFLHGEIFEFSSFFFCLKILFNNVNGKATLCHTPLVAVIANCQKLAQLAVFDLFFFFWEIQVRFIFVRTLTFFIYK